MTTATQSLNHRLQAAAPPPLALAGVFQHVGIHCALADISLTLGRGQWLTVIGPNGAGKSLLTRLILGLDVPSAGTVHLFGEDLARLDGRRLARLRQRLGAVLQGGSLLHGLDVLENLLLPLRARPMSRLAMARAARLVMTQLRLDGMEHHAPRGLSLGQRRRVELARALIHRPELLVWDGLSDGLDPPAVRDIVEVLQAQRQHRGLTVIATDNDHRQSAAAADRVAVIDHGRLLFDGTPATLLDALPRDLALRYIVEGHP
ncbi:MAG: ABC transporter ATP-binding protein [Chromatiaceae bacterium]|nr:MAG: ABC transporter ATP-binding protein [Chromatiaceae bacterium]